MARKANFNREAALEKAIELFWSKGYYASSMKHIENALDMRPGSLYATFGNKAGLFSEALDAYASRSGQEFCMIVASSPRILDGLKKYIRSLAQPCDGKIKQPVQACMVIKTLLEIGAEDLDLHAKVEGILAVFEQQICDVLLKAQVSGEIQDSVDCGRLARLLQTHIIGLRAFSERSVPSTQLEAIADDMAAMLDVYSVA